MKRLTISTVIRGDIGEHYRLVAGDDSHNVLTTKSEFGEILPVISSDPILLTEMKGTVDPNAVVEYCAYPTTYNAALLLSYGYIPDETEQHMSDESDDTPEETTDDLEDDNSENKEENKDDISNESEAVEE